MLMTFAQTMARFGCKSRSFIYDRVAEGTLTQPVQVGVRSQRFPTAEVEAVIAARIAGKSKEKIQALVIELHAKRAQAGEGTIPEATPATAPQAQALHLAGGA